MSKSPTFSSHPVADNASYDRSHGAENAHQRDSGKWACNYCPAEYEPHHEPVKGFCSWRCWGAHRAEKIRNMLEYDHRYCSNCFRKVRNVYPPGRRAGSKHVAYDEEQGIDGDSTACMSTIPDFVTGRAYSLPGTERGTGEIHKPRDPQRGDWTHEPSDEETERTVCGCGAAHHRTTNRPHPADELVAHASRLSQAADDLFREDEHTYDHTPEVVTATVRDSYTAVDGAHQEELLTHALGQAIVDARFSSPSAV